MNTSLSIKMKFISLSKFLSNLKSKVKTHLSRRKKLLNKVQKTFKWRTNKVTCDFKSIRVGKKFLYKTCPLFRHRSDLSGAILGENWIFTIGTTLESKTRLKVPHKISLKQNFFEKIRWIENFNSSYRRIKGNLIHIFGD